MEDEENKNVSGRRYVSIPSWRVLEQKKIAVAGGQANGN